MLIVSLIVLQVIIFFSLILTFRRLMSKNVVSATRHLDDLNKEYIEKEKEINKRLEEAKTKAKEIVARAQDEATKKKTQTIQEAEKERDNILKQARTQSDEVIQHADKSRQLLLSEINERIAKEAVGKACELIQDTLPKKLKQEVHQHWVEELIENGFNELGSIKIPQDAQKIQITSAFTLTEVQRKGILKKLKDTLKRDLELKETDDPKVVAGLIITIGSLVLDGSLKNKIQEQVKGV